jgi:signal transduction histidine kinase
MGDELNLPAQFVILPTPPSDEILVVDDNDVMRDTLCKMLSQSGYRVRDARSGEAALAEIDGEKPDLVLLDISMPYMDGFEVCEVVKANPETRDIPVIFLSALDDIEDKIRAFRVGAVDYVTKPIHPEEVVARVESHLSLARQRKQIEGLSALKDDLISIVSHDLKNPLQIILGYADLLSSVTDRDLLNPEEQVVAALQIKTHANYMLSIIHDLLDLKRIEDGVPLDMEASSLNQLLVTEYEAFELLAEQKQIRLELALPEDDLNVDVDPTRFKQAIHNLLSNAIKYTPSGGNVLLSALVDGDRYLVQIADTGVGICEKDLPNIFKKFYRVKGAQHMDMKGTGLGLSVVQAIIEQHGGTIWVNSIEGRGSTFCISMPL